MPHQVSVFLENKPGRLEKVTAHLAQAGISIRAMTLTTSSAGWGVLNLLVDRPSEAAEALRSSGHPAALRDIVVVELEDRPGGLHDVVALLAASGMNIENAYGTVLQAQRAAILVIDVENVAQAEEVLGRAGVRTWSDDDVYSL